MLRMKESAGGPANGDPVSRECLPHRPTSAILLLRRKDPPCSNPAVARFLMRCALPARNLVLLVPRQCTLPSLSPSRACSLLPRFHHLLLFEPVVALGLWFAWQHYSPSPCPLHCPDQIKSIPGLDWVGPRWAVAMFYFGLGPAGGNTNLPDTWTSSRSIDPPAPTHDNSPSR